MRDGVDGNMQKKRLKEIFKRIPAYHKGKVTWFKGMPSENGGHTSCAKLRPNLRPNLRAELRPDSGSNCEHRVLIKFDLSVQNIGNK